MLETLPVKSVKIIAEVGCNHGGSMETAIEYVKAAKSCGADIVKFQTYYPANLVNPSKEVLEFCQKSYLGVNDHIKLISACKENGIEFLSSAFCIDSLLKLDKIGLKTIKVPSGQIFNEQYLYFLGKMKKKVLLSTGMCIMQDVIKAIRILEENGTPQDDITIMQCTTAYPAPANAANLRVLQTFKVLFPKADIGYSDHTEGWETTLAAVALGAMVIEKHFILDDSTFTPDRPVSLLPEEFRQMVQEIRNVEAALMSSVKAPHVCERAMFNRRDIVNRSYP